MKVITTNDHYSHFGVKKEDLDKGEVMKEYKLAYYDGYGLSEKLLEGVDIKLEILDSGKIEISFHKDYDHHTKNLNQEKFLTEMKNILDQEDNFYTLDDNEEDICLILKDGNYSFE